MRPIRAIRGQGLQIILQGGVTQDPPRFLSTHPSHVRPIHPSIPSQCRRRGVRCASQQIATVRLAPNNSRELAFLRWGLVPSWADDPAIGYKMINARGETVATKPSFRKAFKARRCLVVADGFYEWQKTDGKKQPHYIRLKHDGPFAFAGLWEHWGRDGTEIDSCTIITTDANELMAPIHNRMPVILAPTDYDVWLDPAVEEVERLQPLLRPFPAGEMTAYPVSTVVNSPRNETEECVAAVG